MCEYITYVPFDVRESGPHPAKVCIFLFPIGSGQIAPTITLTAAVSHT